jgi:hypothetical protein
MGGNTATGGSTGSTVAPPPTPTLPSPACINENKDGSCTGSAVCYKTCGPDSQGQKTLTCNGSKLLESECTFSSTTNYACYRLTSVAKCASTPTAGTNCSVDPCKPCGGSSGTVYYDSSNNPKAGYCVCTNSKWSCASVTAWPCPDSPGC